MPDGDFQAWDFQATCTQCHTVKAGRLHFSTSMKVVDSDGGLLFRDGWSCHVCLGEPWLSSEVGLPCDVD